MRFQFRQRQKIKQCLVSFFKNFCQHKYRILSRANYNIHKFA